MKSVLLCFGTAAFGVSGLFLGLSTYRLGKDRDWEATAIGAVLALVCAAGAVWLGMKLVVG